MFQNVEAWSHDEVAKLLNVIKREGAALERVFDALPDCIAVVTREGKVHPKSPQRIMGPFKTP